MDMQILVFVKNVLINSIFFARSNFMQCRPTVIALLQQWG